MNKYHFLIIIKSKTSLLQGICKVFSQNMNDDSIHHDKRLLHRKPGSQYAYSVKHTGHFTLSLTDIFGYKFQNNEDIIAIFTTR